MAIASVSSTTALTQLYKGFAADTKPTENVQAFALFIETDTSDIYRYSGTSWTIVTFM